MLIVMSMSRTIELQYIWDLPLALKASQRFYQFEFKHSYRRYLGWFFIALAQFGVVGALKHDSYGILILSTLFLAYWYLLRWEIRKVMVRKHFKGSAHSNQKVRVHIDANGIESNTQQVSWSDIIKVIEVEEGFLIYTLEQSLFIPKKDFASGSDRNDFRELLRDKINFFSKES